MSSLFSMDWTCCRCQHENASCTKCICQHSYCHECADALGCVAHGSVNNHNHRPPLPHFTSSSSTSSSTCNSSPSLSTSSSTSTAWTSSPPTPKSSFHRPSHSAPTSHSSSPTGSKSNIFNHNNRAATAFPLALPPQELVAPFATPRNSVSLTSLTTTITTNNPAPASSRRRFFPLSVHDLGSRRRRSKSPQHRKTPSATPSIDEDYDKPHKVSRIDRWWIDL